MAAIEPLDVLSRGALTVKGRLPDSSNATLLVEAVLDDVTLLAVYKPMRGERPLWDFPRGLFRREIAAWHLSEALGWGLVPLTIPREGPYGEGSLQQFIHADFEQHYFTLREMPEHLETLQRVCAFDLIANNADRKSGHCLVADNAIYAIDNGLCFHVEPKLRTVIWDFAGQPVPEPALADLRRFVDGPVPEALRELLDPRRVPRAARPRAGAAAQGCFPGDRTGQGYPWPLV